MKKYLMAVPLAILIWCFIFVSFAYAASFKIGTKVYSNEKIINLDCDNIQDSGVGLSVVLADESTKTGQMRFRIKPITSTTWSDWTEYKDFDIFTSINTLEINPNIEYEIQAEFCDVLENCATEESLIIVAETFQYVNEIGVSGTINIPTDFTVRIGN